jgi:7-cyano-7-deazaguanine synthase
MDSVTALHHLVQQGRVAATIGFLYGARHHARELECARIHAKHLGVVHHEVALPFIGELFSSALLAGGAPIPKGHYEEETMKQTVVPFRNGIMLAIAAGFAECVGVDGVAIAAHSGDHAIYPDCREPFMAAISEAIRLGTYAGVRVERPFIGLTKADICARGSELGVDFAQTWSCYVGGTVHCGECGTCVERREAFLLAGVHDPTPYLSTAPLPPKPGLRGGGEP